MAKHKFQAPNDLSPEGKELLDRIDNRIGNGNLLKKVIVVGSAMANGETIGATAQDLPETAEGLGQIDKILRERIRTDIDLTNLKRPMGNEERKFFEGLRDTILDPDRLRKLGDSTSTMPSPHEPETRSENEYEDADDPTKGKHDGDGYLDEDGQWHDYPDPIPGSTSKGGPDENRPAVAGPGGDFSRTGGLPERPHEKWIADCDKAPTCWCGEKHCGTGVAR